jgi:hypothetical protein
MVDMAKAAINPNTIVTDSITHASATLQANTPRVTEL